MTRERRSRRGISTTEYNYDTFSTRPILEIRRTLDTDGDGILESEVGNAMFRTLAPRRTSMGGRAVALEEVLA